MHNHSFLGYINYPVMASALLAILKNHIIPKELWPLGKNPHEEELGYDFYLGLYVEHFN